MAGYCLLTFCWSGSSLVFLQCLSPGELVMKSGDGFVEDFRDNHIPLVPGENVT